MLLKIGKMLPGVQNDSPVVNTPTSLNSLVVNTTGSLDSLVMNTQGSLDSPVMNTPGSRLLCVLWTSIRTCSQKNCLVNNRPGSQGSPVYYSQGSLNSLVYFALAGSFRHLFISTPRWWIHRGVSTPRWWIHRGDWFGFSLRNGYSCNETFSSEIPQVMIATLMCCFQI